MLMLYTTTFYPVIDSPTHGEQDGANFNSVCHSARTVQLFSKHL